jgi:diguanylate cyclase (GGDEF)-like protein
MIQNIERARKRDTMSAVTTPGISRINWHLVGAVGSALTQAIMILAAVSVSPGLALRGWLWFAGSFVMVGLIYWLIQDHRSPGWWMIWPALGIVRIFIFGLGDPTAARLTTGLVSVFFLFAGLTQPQGRSLLLLPPSLIVLRGLIDLPLHLAIVRLIIAAIVLSMACELPAYLLRHLAAQQKVLTLNAGTDSLTGAQNRRGLDDLMDRMQGRAYLVIVDLDEFKLYNDTFGHLAGDRVLIDFSAMLHQETRRNDVVVRYGGEEFLIVLAGADQQRAELVVGRWAQAWGRNASGTTFSAGITDLEGDDALRRADTSLYAAKAGGRARAVVGLSTAGAGHARSADVSATGDILESHS